MIFEKMSSFLWTLELGLWTYSLIYLSGPSGPNLVSRHLTLGPGIFWDFIVLLDQSYDFGENEILFVKIGARVLDLGLICLLGPGGPKVV